MFDTKSLTWYLAEKLLVDNREGIPVVLFADI